MKIDYRSPEHFHRTNYLMERMDIRDAYHKVLAYLFALDDVCYNHIDDLFDFEENAIFPDAINEPWQTAISRKTTRLAYNLWNGCCTDGEHYYDINNVCKELPSCNYTVDGIFDCSYAFYFWNAIKIRYPEYAPDEELERE